MGMFGQIASTTKGDKYNLCIAQGLNRLVICKGGILRIALWYQV